METNNIHCGFINDRILWGDGIVSAPQHPVGGRGMGRHMDRDIFSVFCVDWPTKVSSMLQGKEARERRIGRTIEGEERHMKLCKIIITLLIASIGIALFTAGCTKKPQLNNDFSLEVVRKRVLLLAEQDDFYYTNHGPSLQDVHMKITYWETEGNFGSEGGARTREEHFSEWKSEECKTITPADTIIDRIYHITIEVEAKEGVCKKEFTKGSFRIIDAR